MKLCLGCGNEKSDDQFPNNPASPDGKHSRCRACRALKAKARRERPEIKASEAIRLREQYLANRDALLAKRKERYAAKRDAELRRNKAWSDANREYHRALNRQWSKDNPGASRALVARRRALLAGAEGSYTKADIDDLWKEQKGLCAACNCRLNESGYHIDHIVPLSKGGANSKDNLQLLCPTCNRRKGAKLPWEWKHEVHL